MKLQHKMLAPYSKAVKLLVYPKKTNIVFNHRGLKVYVEGRLNALHVYLERIDH